MEALIDMKKERFFMWKKGFSFKIAAYLLILLTFSNFSLANKIIYVDDDANGVNNGSSWQNAYKYIQDALTDAKNSGKPVEIRVAQGTYKPDQGAGQTAGDREASFVLINNVALLGGYAGILESDPDKRDYEKYQTVLSGDLAGNDIEINDPNRLKDEPTRAENCFTIVRARKVNDSAVFDGFTVCKGNQNVYLESSLGSPSGVGIHISESKVIVNDCIFSFNSGDCAMSITIMSEPNVTNCMFSFNTTGISNYNSKPNITKCAFSKNRLAMNNSNSDGIKLFGCQFIENYSAYGGAIYNRTSIMKLYNCSFIRNNSGYGGAIYNTLSTLLFTNCIFFGNSAKEKGAGIYTIGYNVTLTNCTFTANISKEGSALACESITNTSRINNCILWDDGNEIWYNVSSITIDHSDIQHGQSSIYGPINALIWGDGNIDSDPLFADSNNGDYHLKSQAGRFDPNTQSWVQDSETSPCIDTGDQNSPIGYEPFPNGGYINMGAYGGTSEASKSYFGKPVCTTIVAGDINGDCKVDILDLEIMMSHWLEEH
jgi:hypothetical protein